MNALWCRYCKTRAVVGPAQPLPRASLTLPMAEDPISALQSHQPLPQPCHSRAHLQLPTTLPCLDTGPVKLGPSGGPHASWALAHALPQPGRCPVTMAMAALVPPAALLPAGLVGQALADIPWTPQRPEGPDGEHIWTRLYFK